VELENDGSVLVVGAGICGLTAAHLLAKAGRRVTLLEKLDRVGGLARSFQYGDYIFDIGPHRFHTANQQIGAYIKEVLGEDGVYFPRRSSVYFKGRYYPWPIRPQSLAYFPKAIGAHAAFDLMVNPLRKYEGDTFETYVLRQYGPTIYKHFFHHYSQKFLKIHPQDTHADWARTGINRAIIDDKVKMNNLGQVVQSVFANATKPDLNFLYPRLGMQSWCYKAADAFQKCGGELLTGVDDVSIRYDRDRITEVRAQGRTWKPATVIWTGSPIQISQLLDLPQPQLEFLAIIMYYIELRAIPPEAFQWCYFGEKDFIFNRISNNIYFSDETAPWGCCGLEVEVSCKQGDEVWNHPEALTERVVADLKKARLVCRDEEINAIHIERIPYSYPIYDLHYRERLKETQKRLARWKNLIMAGRTGQFWYNNMDHSIGKALSVAKKMLGQESHVEGADFGREFESEEGY